MPITPTYPGIYIQEAPNSTHTIIAAPTNIAVFIGYTHPLKTLATKFGKATLIGSFQDYQRQFGGFLRSGAFANAIDPTVAAPDTSFGDMAQAVNQFFLNGGTQAYVVALRSQHLASLSPVVPSDPTIPTGTLSGAQSAHTGPLTFWAREITDETYQLTVQVTPANPPPGSPPPTPTADIVITYGPQPLPNTTGPAPGTVVETYRQVNTVMGPNDPNYITKRINGVSALVWVTVTTGSPPPSLATANETLDLWLSAAMTSTYISQATDFTNQLQADTNLDKQPVFNLMVLPGVTNTFVLSTAQAFCERKYAFLVEDPPLTPRRTEPIRNSRSRSKPLSRTCPPARTLACISLYLKSANPFTGLSTDPLTKKVYEISGLRRRWPASWPAPTLRAACGRRRPAFRPPLNNTPGVVARGQMTDPRQGVLNPLGVNCLRDFPNIGTVVFGARTTCDHDGPAVALRSGPTDGAVPRADPLRQPRWVVFEPNAEPLWSAITMSISLHARARSGQGAFQGDDAERGVQCPM